MPTTGPQQFDENGMPASAILATNNDIVKTPQPDTRDKVIDFLRPLLGNLGGLGVNAAIGPANVNPIAAFGANNLGYTGVDAALQYLKSQSQRPANLDEAIMEGEKNALINAASGKLIHGALSVGRGIFTSGASEISKLAPTASQALEAYGHNALATTARLFENFVPSAKSAALDRSGGEGFTQALSMVNAMNRRLEGTNIDPVKLTDQLKATLEGAFDSKINPISGSREYFINQEAKNIINSSGQDTFKVLDDVIANPDKLSKILQVGKAVGVPNMDVKKDLQAYQFMKMVQNATTQDAKGKIRIDPDMLAKDWYDPKMNTSFNTLYGKDGMERISDFFKNIAYTQTNGPDSTLLRYTTRGGFLLGAGLLAKGLHLSTPTTAIGAIVGPYAIGKMLTTETVGNIMVKLAEGAKLNEVSPLAPQLITKALSGITTYIVDRQGNVIKGHTETDPESGDSKWTPDK